jgi:hypothetical protein
MEYYVLLGIDPSTYRRKLMAEIDLAILVVYHDLTLLLYYLSPFTVLTNQKFRKGTNKFKLDAVKQHENSKPHQYYQSRYMMRTCQLNLLNLQQPSVY